MIVIYVSSAMCKVMSWIDVGFLEIAGFTVKSIEYTAWRTT